MIRLADPIFGDGEFSAVINVLKSGYLVQDERVKEFEKRIAEYLNVKHAIAVSSGTAALHLALIALCIGQGQEVIVPDFTFPATANVVELTGAKIKFVDIEPDTFCINAEEIEKIITPKTSAIIPVHEFGHPADMDKIMQLAVKYGLKVIEDAACALGTEYKGRKVGTIGHIGCFSFHPRKAITTGEGGIVATNCDEAAEKIRALRNHGLSSAGGKAQFIYAGFNYRMTDIQGALGTAQLKKLDSIIEKRRGLAEIYNNMLKDIGCIVLPSEKPYARHVYQTYHVMVSEDIDRGKLIADLKERGIEANFGAYCVHMQTYYREKYGFDKKDFPCSVNAFEHGLALPMHSGLNADDIVLIKRTLWELLN